MWRGCSNVRKCMGLGHRWFRAAMLVLATLIFFAVSQGPDATAGEPDTPNSAGGVRVDTSFDHTTTAFPLTGKHVSVTCESCHYNAVFKGAGKLCIDCHNGVSRAGPKVSSKPVDHIPASDTCDTCHITASWKTVRVDHRDLNQSCVTCHNGKSATGKSVGHVPVTENCKGCHATASWLPVRMDHSDMAGPCGLCHDGRRADGKPVNHIKTSAECDTCHAVSAWKPAGFAHIGISGNCASCHNGVKAQGKVAQHFQTGEPCETCHFSTRTFSGTRMNHTGITSGCLSCHNGARFQGRGKVPNHFQTALACETCHSSFISFAGTKMNHLGISDGCARCHNGGKDQGKGKPPTHFLTSQPCETCHTNFLTFTATRMNHVGISDSCARCHNGVPFQGKGKSGRHIPTSEPCELCHSSFVQFTGHYDAGASMNHEGITSGCARCHNGQTYQGIGKQPSSTTGLPHPVTSYPCEHCHSGFFRFSGASVVARKLHHQLVTKPCASCHNGVTATGKPPKVHFVTARQCETCHVVTAWNPLTFRHVSAAFPTGHSAALPCRNCHASNAEAVSYRMPGLRPACAACHAQNYKQLAHQKFLMPRPGFYKVDELKDCSGACHVYTDSSLKTIKERRQSHHRSGGGAF